MSYLDKKYFKFLVKIYFFNKNIKIWWINIYNYYYIYIFIDVNKKQKKWEN